MTIPNLVPLGETGLKVTRLVFGALPMGPLQANLAPEEGGELIRYALERGVNLIDTAELYGTYQHLNRGLKGFSGKVHIASKTHAVTAGDARRHVERALREIDVDFLDIVHIHGARIADPFIERADVLAALIRMKEEGLIHHIGLSTHYICALEKAAARPEIEVVHPLINSTGMGILDGSRDQMAAAIARCAAAGKGVYAMKALAGGNLISAARLHFRYVLGLDGVHGLAVGMLSREEIDGNYGLFCEEREDQLLWARLEQKRREIKIMENFCKGCGACVPACTNQGIYLENGKARIRREECILCGYCAAACPDFIIRVV
ncbi:MAG: aldo/keto reductase [Desulfuromonadales bacterium]|nr:aldo/keto reductase [Desulfuromonadales bacterium]